MAATRHDDPGSGSPAIGQQVFSAVVLLALLGSFFLVRRYLNADLISNLTSFANIGPFDLTLGAVLARLVDHLHTIAAAGIVGLSSLLIGDRLLQRRLHPWQLQVAVSTVLGYTVLTLIFYVLAAGHILYSAVLQVAIVAVPLLRWRRTAILMRRLASLMSAFRPSLLDGCLLATACILAGSSLLYALAPPVTYDALQYHLSTPQAYLQAHALVDIPHNLTSHYPPYIGTVYFLGRVFGSECAPQLLSWYTGLLTALLVYGFAVRHAQARRAGLLAVVVLLSVPYVFVVTSQVWVDLAVALAVCCALVLLLEWHEHHQTRQVVLAGALAGFALGAKYSAVIDLVALQVVLAAILLRSKHSNWRQRCRTFVVFNLLALAVAAPHLGWTLLRTGNPVFPMAAEVFPQPDWFDAEATTDVFSSNRRAKVGNPLLVYYDLFFRQHLHNASVGPMPQIGLLVLLLALRRRVPHACHLLLLFLMVDCIAYWAARGVSLRYASSITVVLVLLSVWVWQQVLDNDGMPRTAVFLVLPMAGWLLSFQLMLGNLGTNGLRYTFALIDREPYLEQQLMTSYSGAATFLNTSPETGRVLLIGESRAYYLTRRCIADAPYSEPSIIGDIARAAVDSRQIGQTLRDMAVTDVLVNMSETMRVDNSFHDWDHNTLQRFLTFLHDETDVVYRDDRVVVLRIHQEVRTQDQPSRVFDEKPYYLGNDPAVEVFKGLRHITALADQGRYQEVLLEYQRLSELAPHTRQLHQWAAEAAAALGSDEVAAEHRREAAQLIEAELDSRDSRQPPLIIE